MSMLAVIIGAICFFGSILLTGLTGNVLFFMGLNFVWIFIFALGVRIKNQINDPVDNIYLIKEIYVQIALVVTSMLIIFLLVRNGFITRDLSIVLGAITVVSCGFILVDSYTYLKNKAKGASN